MYTADTRHASLLRRRIALQMLRLAPRDRTVSAYKLEYPLVFLVGRIDSTG